MPTYAALPDYRRLAKPLIWLGSLALGLGLLGYLLSSVRAWLGYLLLMLALGLWLLGMGIGSRWLYRYPQLVFSEKGITLRWPWGKRFIHWREVLRIDPSGLPKRDWLLGISHGYQL